MKLTFNQIRLIADTAESKIRGYESDIQFMEECLNEDIEKAIVAKQAELGVDALDAVQRQEVINTIQKNNWRVNDIQESKKLRAMWDELLTVINIATY